VYAISDIHPILVIQLLWKSSLLLHSCTSMSSLVSCRSRAHPLRSLLGLSAFAGFIVVLVGWPLNSFVMKRSIRIQKGVAASRDKRMGVLNELISAVKFIKFFAWEERWIDRAVDARKVEIGWMIKGRLPFHSCP